MFGGEEFNFIFGFKIYLIRYPKQFIAYSLFVTLFFFAFILRVVERPIMELLENPSMKDWVDILWFCIITTSTSRLSFTYSRLRRQNSIYSTGQTLHFVHDYLGKYMDIDVCLDTV